MSYVIVGSVPGVVILWAHYVPIILEVPNYCCKIITIGAK